MSNNQKEGHTQSEDSELIESFLDGREEAFNKLVNKYKERVYYLSLRILGNHHDAEEASSDAFIKAHKALKGLKERKYFFTWLYRITYNACLNKKKAQRYTEPLENVKESAGRGANLSEEAVEKDQMQAAIKELAGRLPPQQKAVFMMRLYDDLKFEEIARSTGLTVGGAKSNYFNAVCKVRKGIREKYGLQ